jgi:hypothetical protein
MGRITLSCLLDARKALEDLQAHGSEAGVAGGVDSVGCSERVTRSTAMVWDSVYFRMPCSP